MSDDAAIREYEFSDTEEETIENFADSMLNFSIVLPIIGTIFVIFGILDNFDNVKVLTGVIWLVFGLTFYFPVDNIRNIVETEGSDIEELMEGLGEVRIGWAFVNIILFLKIIVALLGLLSLT